MRSTALGFYYVLDPSSSWWVINYRLPCCWTSHPSWEPVSSNQQCSCVRTSHYLLRRSSSPIRQTWELFKLNWFLRCGLSILLLTKHQWKNAKITRQSNCLKFKLKPPPVLAPISKAHRVFDRIPPAKLANFKRICSINWINTMILGRNLWGNLRRKNKLKAKNRVETGSISKFPISRN